MISKGIQALIISALLLFSLSILTFSTAQEAQNKEEAQNTFIEFPITSWLVLGPFSSPLPAFHEDDTKSFAMKDLLKHEEIDISLLKPKDKRLLRWHDRTSAKWETTKAEENCIKLKGGDTHPSLAYLAVYIDVMRWTKAKVTLKSPQLFQIYLDGKVVITKASVQNSETENAQIKGRKASADLCLETGKHLLLVKTLFAPESNSDWILHADLSCEEKYASPSPILTLSPEQKMTIKHLLDGPKVTNASISPDGTFVALSMRQTLPPSNQSESWVEIYEVDNGSLIQTYRGGPSLSRVNWAPDGKKFSYTSRNKSGGTIWIVNMETKTAIPLLKDVKDLGSHVWAPNSRFIIYSITEKNDSNNAQVKRFINLADRQPWWRDRSYLYKISIPDRVRQRLTAGKLSTSLNSINPDGKNILFTRQIVDYSERPYSVTELYSLDLTTLEAQLLWKGKWLRNAQWGPKGKRLLILGGPSTFGSTGVSVPNYAIPNDYDTQAFLFNLKTKDVEPITKSFNPSIDQAIWSQDDKSIYFLTTDRSYRNLYRYDLNKKEFSFIYPEVEFIERFGLAEKKPIAVYIGSSANLPPKAYSMDLQKKKVSVLCNPGQDDFSEVKFGKVERWIFKNKKGVDIEGRIYYPPDFDPTQKYPCIVYYYGGTSPVTRDFGGRYPKNLYAAQGYVVYVLQPSGATGFGQKFSSYHVNDWGLIVADEIIDGVKKFLAAHPFVDPKKVGCMGASYGGFMTMLLCTRTTIFSAAIAHAGISSISSYWGEGYWGYAYSAVASANSFPWNRKDIYINQSPLFNADMITTPLLLLHGSADTNVPPGESTQLFTALKLLGKEVEYIQIMDQDHHIMTYNKRIIWTKTIMAWFDRWLKDQPEWWIDLYNKES